jgi:hypothetical protein
MEAEASRGDLNERAGCSTSPRWSSSLAAQRNADPADPNKEDFMELKEEKATNLGI